MIENAIGHGFAGRDLKPFELRALALSLVSRPELWRARLPADPQVRVYEELIRDEHVGVWAIAWPRDDDAGFHDQGVSSGALAVVEGAVSIQHLRSGGGAIRRLLWPGQATDFSAADVHRVALVGPSPALTIHAYSQPQWQTAPYEDDREPPVRGAMAS